MASVPYSPVPTVAPDASGTQGMSINAPGAAFGEATAAALGNLGNVIEQSGDRLFRRAIAIQELKNDSEAKDADADYMIQAGQMHAEYNTLKGKAAVDAFPKYMEDLKTVREGIGSRLTNNSARKMYDNSTRGTMGRTIFNGAGHAATQNKQWAIGTAKANIDLDAKTVEDNPNDEVLFQSKLDRFEKNAKMAYVRKAYLLKNGIEFDFTKGDNGGLSLDNVPGLLDREGDQIEADFIAREGLSEEEAQRRAEAVLRQKYSL